jgi:hypothetical protein
MEVSSTLSKTGVAREYGYGQPVAPAHDRGHECTQALRGDAEGHIHSCKRFATFLKRSPDAARAGDIRRFQLHLSETGASICNRNRIMTGFRFLFRATLRRLDLAAEIYHLREPQKIPLVMSQDETRRLLAVASSLKVRVLLSLGYGCGLRAGEVVRLKVKHIDSAQKIIRVEQSKSRKDRNVICCANGGRRARPVSLASAIRSKPLKLVKLPGSAKVAVMVVMRTKSREVIWGGQIMGAIRARHAREEAQKAARQRTARKPTLLVGTNGGGTTERPSHHRPSASASMAGSAGWRSSAIVVRREQASACYDP